MSQKTLTALSLFMLCSSTLWAAPLSSMIEQRSSYNSRDQQGYYLVGAHSIDAQTGLNLAFTHYRTPVDTIGTETYFQEALGASYTLDNTIMVDGNFQLSQSPQPQIYSIGGGVGVVLNWFDKNSSSVPSLAQLAGMSRIRAQFDEEAYTELVLSARFGMGINNFTSSLLPGSSAQEDSYSLDLTKPLNDDFTASAGVIYYSYNDANGFFTQALSDNFSSERFLLGSTIQGLPIATLSTRLTAIIADFDTFVPSYSASMLQTSKLWTHTVSGSWKHEFSRNWVITPGYEVTMQKGLTTSGFLLDLLYRF